MLLLVYIQIIYFIARKAIQKIFYILNSVDTASREPPSFYVGFLW